jgi:hypothetical protein
VASATTAAAGTAGWIPVVFGIGASVFAAWLAADLSRAGR